MKILHITDSHGTVKSPESRKDVYYISFLKKLYELGYVIKKENIDMVIHTGDLFHTARVSDKFAGQVSEMIKGWKIPVYVVPGNHDIEGYTVDTIDQTKLGLLAKAGVINILDRNNPITINVEQDWVYHQIYFHFLSENTIFVLLCHRMHARGIRRRAKRRMAKDKAEYR